MSNYNFNEHIKQKLINRFRGSERKETIVLDDDNEYLLKLPDPSREKDLCLSYVNNAVSEYIGCKIIKEIGLPVQEVILGEYTTSSSKGTEKTYIACACKNVEHDGLRLTEAETSVLGSYKSQKSAEVASFESLDKIAECTSGITLSEIKEFYANQFVVDALIGNRDRHNGNWGFLTGKDGNEISPIYDCGSSLCPLYDDEELSEAVARNEALNGLSKIKDSDGHNIVYKKFLEEGKNEDVNDALKRIVPNINMTHIMNIVNETPYISDTRKSFYNCFLEETYNQVLVPALNKILDRDIEFRERNINSNELYELYKQTIRILGDVPVYGRVNVSINGDAKTVIRTGTKNIIITSADTKEAEAVISVRSNNVESWKALQTLSQVYNCPMESLQIKMEITAKNHTKCGIDFSESFLSRMENAKKESSAYNQTKQDCNMKEKQSHQIPERF